MDFLPVEPMDLVNYLYWLIRQPAGSVEWKSTRIDLVELVLDVAMTERLRDGRGYPMTQRRLAEMAFRAVGLPFAPKHLPAVVFRIRNRVRVKPPLEKRIQGNIDDVIIDDNNCN